MENENKGLYKYGPKKIKELDINLWNRINEIDLDITFKEKFYLLESSLLDVPKCECGLSVKFVDMQKGYRDFCSKRCMYDSTKIKKNRQDSCMKKWGVDNPSKAMEVRDRVMSTNIEKFGHEWATKSDEVKKKIKDKFVENWGVDNPSKIKEVRDKAKETMMNKFGVEHAMHSEQIKKKVKDKFVENWGVDNPSKIKEVRDKAKETMLNRWGVEYPLQNSIILSKSKRTMIERWGVDNPLKSKEILDKMKVDNIEKWGVDNPSKSDTIKDKIRNSILDRYNTLNLLEIDEIRNKIEKSNMDRFGESHISKNSEYREKYKIANHSNYIKYLGDGISLFSCDSGKDHEFEISIDNFYHRDKNNIYICTTCNPIGDLKSIKEKELYLFIKGIYAGEIIQSYRDWLEIDIYLPDLKIGFEFNGLYWHSEQKKDKNYHSEKTRYFSEKGIRIIHIWEDDWKFGRDIIKSQIENWLGLTKKKIWARKCETKLVNDTKILKDFLNKNHIQGYVNSILAVGLYSDGNLVGLMTFDHSEGRKKMVEGGWNLSRFCNRLDFNVVGGASKLLSFFIKSFEPKRIVSYADKSWSRGELYYKLGFEKVDDSRPDYKYIVNDRRVHKSRYRKSNLKISGISESEYTKMNNINKIWDCGKLKFEMLIK